MKRSSEGLEHQAQNTSQLSTPIFPKVNLGFKPKTSGEYGRSVYGYERIYLNHKAGTFSSSSGPDSEFMASAAPSGPRAIYVHPLALIRTRQMWPKRDGESPSADPGKLAAGGKQCISLDGNRGHPLNNFPRTEYIDGGGLFDSDGNGRCETCPFTKWSDDGKHGPQCQPHWYIPMFPIGSQAWSKSDSPPAILDLTQSGITTFRKFFKSAPGWDILFDRPIAIKAMLVEKNKIRFARPSFEFYNTHLKPTGIERMYMTYWSRKVREDFGNENNVPNMSGSKGSSFVALKPTGA